MKTHVPRSSGKEKAPSRGRCGAEGTRSTARAQPHLRAQEGLGNQEILQLHREGLLHPKLEVGAPDDPLEREADEVADAVVQRKPSSSAMIPVGPRKASRRVGADPSDPTSRSSVSRLGSGRSLDPATNAFFGSRLDQDVSHVRIHTGPVAETAAASIGARAYTLGRDIVFGRGQYQPDTKEGQRLLAHELTHVAQQAGMSGTPGLIQRNGNGDDDTAEEETGALPFDPTTIEPSALTHGDLNDYTRRTDTWLDGHTASHESYDDFEDLRDQLSDERFVRVGAGHMWLAEAVEEDPDALVKLVYGEGGRIDVVSVELETANAESPTSTVNQTMTESQFQSYLADSRLPTLDYDTYVRIQLMNAMMSGEAFGLGEGIGGSVGSEGGGPLASPGTLGANTISLPGSQASVSGMGGVGLYNAPLDVSLMDTYSRPMRGRGSGGPFRAYGRFAEAGVPAQARNAFGVGLLDLNTLGWTNRAGNFQAATRENYPTFDFQRTQGPMARILGVSRISVKTSLRANQVDRFRYYLQGIDAMMEAGSGRSSLRSYIANQPDLAGVPYDQARSTVLRNAMIAVNADDAAALRRLLANPTQAAISPSAGTGTTLWNDTGHRGGPQTTTSIRGLYAAEMRESPVRIETSSGTRTYNTPDALDQARSSNTITNAQYEAAQREVGRRVSRRVMSSGVSTTEVQSLRTGRGTTLTQAQLDPVLTPEYVATVRQGGGIRGQLRAAGGSGARGGAGGTLLALVTTAGMMLIDEAEHPNWKQELGLSAGLGLFGGAVGGTAEQVLISQGTRYAINRTAAGAPTWLTGTRLTGLGRFGGGGVAAGALELVSMGFLEDREHSGAEVAVRTGRAFVLGGASTYAGVAVGTGAGAILTSALAGTAVGTAVPGLGNAIGFIVGLAVGVGIYLAADRIIPGGREDWEPSQGCFAAGTRVLMADGTERPIETIQVGDEVAAFNELTSSATRGVVEVTHHHPPESIVRLTLANGRTLRVTRRHRVFADGRWVGVEDLEPGRACLCATWDDSGTLGPVPIESIELEPGPQEVFNLTVAEHHTYFAEGVVVHNRKAVDR